MILVFDLDDTLYDETSFVKSGFRQVASYMHEIYKACPEESFNLMMNSLNQNGRGRVFDDLLAHYGLINKQNTKKLVSIYRSHKPAIHLYKEAAKCLERFKDLPLYIVTDGNKIVQNNKITSLKLQDRVKHSFITYRYGRKNSKPSPYCFLKICEREKVPPKKVAYIGDNPYKDFVGIKPLGFRTIRVLTGQYRNVKKEKEYEAEFSIANLSELRPDFLEKDVI